MRLTKTAPVLLIALLPICAYAQSPPPPDPPSATPPGQSEAPPKASPALKEARKKMRTACAADTQKFCANIEPGNRALQACLTSHRSDLSAGCTSAREEVRATRVREKGK